MVPKRRWTSLVAVGVLLATSGFNEAWGQTAGPRLQMSTRDWDFGQIWTGDPCTTEVELKNIGDATLKILNVRTSCGCAVAEPGKRVLAPGESDSMTVTYDSKKNVKVVKQYVTITTNDAVEPEIRFQMHGEVWNVFDALPHPALALGKVQPNSQKSKSIDLISNLKEKAYPKLRPLGSDVPFEVELEEVEPGKKYRLKARIKPPLKLGNNHVKAVIETGVERLPTMSIGVSARAMDRVSVWPEKLRVVPSQKKRGTRTIRIYYLEGEPIEVTEILCDLPNTTVQKLARQKPTELSEFAALPLRISVPAYLDFPDAGALVEIHTNASDPRLRKFVVPIDKVDPQEQKRKAQQSKKPG